MSQETLDKSARPKEAPPAHKKPYDPEKLIGKTLAGRYEVEQCIGKGGMGVVYLARQTALGRKVVIKVLPASFVDDDEAIVRFEREAQGMSRLQHPHIVAIYDFGHDADQAFICMEYVNGETLTARIRREGPTPAQDFAQIASQILQGIGEAHSMGLVHRDIKPSNIMLTERHGRQNYAKILDFGLAKLGAGAVDVTKDQALVGSAAYLSPEQIMGHPSDHRVDIYAMGVLFYYMLSGQKPFVADDDITVLYQHVHQAPEPLANCLPENHRVPEALVELVERMLAKSPDERPSDAPSILRELVDIMAATSMQLADFATQVTSGEYSALSPSSSNILDDPSAILERNRAHTPQPYAGAGASRDSNSHQILHRAESGSHPEATRDASFVTGEQIAQIQKEQNQRTIRIVSVAVVLIVGGLIGAFVWLSPFQDDPAGANLDTTRAQLARAESFIEQKKFGRAENILELVEPTLVGFPELQSDYAASRDNLETGRLLSRAQILEESGQTAQAIETYQQVRQQNPANPEARAAISRLSAAQKKANEPAEVIPGDTASQTQDSGTPGEANKDTPQDKQETPPTKETKKNRRRPAKRNKPRSKTPPQRSAGSAKPTPDKKSESNDSSDDVYLLPIDEKKPDAPAEDSPAKKDDNESVPLLNID